MKQLVIFLVLASNLIFAQIGNTGRTKTGFIPGFYSEVVTSASETQGKSKVDLYMQFPYSVLQFVKTNNQFEANYTVTIEIKNDDTDEVITDVYDESITTLSYETSVSPQSRKISIRSFELPAGEYEFEILVTDNESSNEFEKTFEKEILVKENNTFLSDVILIRNSVEISGKKQLVPNISRILLQSQRNLSFYLNVFSDTERSINLTYKILDAEDERVFEISEPFALKKGSNTVVKTLTHLNINLGLYKLIVHETGKDDDEDLRTKSFRSIIKGFPPSITDLNVAIKQLKYIARPFEYDAINSDSLTHSQKMQQFIAFWKTKDPDPSTPRNEVLVEYYRRVDFANQRFKGYGEGWKTDMGFIYILFGNPDTVDRQPFNNNSKPYEIWFYNKINRRFIFVDRTGFGDYRLLNDDFRDLTDFRY